MHNYCHMRAVACGLAIPVWIVLAGCEQAEKAPAPPASGPAAQGGQVMKSLTITSTAFGHNQPVPRKYTGDGQDISPPLQWTEIPEGTRELALIVDDPDAPTPQPWVHWVAYRIPPDTKGLPEGVAPSLRGPGSILQGKNSWNKVGYGGPAPPPGHGLHHYHFKLYALDKTLTLDPGATKDAVVSAIAGHVLAEGVLTGTYQR